MASTAAATAMHLCNQCQGSFPTTVALAQHLLEHNMLRALQSDPATSSPSTLPTESFAATLSRDSPTDVVYMPGSVVTFDENKCYGFLKRLAPGAHGGQVFFHLSACDVQTPFPKRGERVTFVERRGPKGMNATSVRRSHVHTAPVPPATAPRAAEPVGEALVEGVVTSYAVEGGFGTIATLEGTSSSSLHFSIASCDIKRPPLTMGERVEVTATVGPKGPTAGRVYRVTMNAAPDLQPLSAPSKTKKKQSRPTLAQVGSQSRLHSSDPSPDVLLAAVSRAMHMLMSSPRRANQFMGTPSVGSVQPASPLRPEQYEGMLRNLSDAEEWAFSLSAAVAMLARTKPAEALNLQGLDTETQRALLLECLQEELDRVRHNALRAQAEVDFLTARDLDFGYAALPSPVGARSHQPPPAPAVLVPERPRTMYCGICREEEPVEDIFLSSGCEHAYCRDMMRTFILGCLDKQEVAPRCPHDGCEAVLSDVDLTQVLTADEQDRYYNMCLTVAAGSVPDMFKCLHENCYGVVALPPQDPHFVCPLCNSERCVQCNTREWHVGLTCEQLRQRQRDNELHPEQVRQIYGDNVNVYQCGGCSYGPIERSGCGNMATHHNEAVGGVRFNNACPRCGWFADDIAQWPRWNGQLHTVLPPQA